MVFFISNRISERGSRGCVCQSDGSEQDFPPLDDVDTASLRSVHAAPAERISDVSSIASTPAFLME